jgi:DNA-binding LacI/PurR family transcriptional regulator
MPGRTAQLREGVSIRDVATAAGVSAATVSRVVNGNAQVAASTRTRVVEAMERLGYHPNLAAKALAGGRTGAVGLLVPSIANPFYGALAEGVDDMAGELGYHVFITHVDHPRAERDALASLVSRRVDGILMAAAEASDEVLGPLAASGLPVVLLAREVPGLDVSCIVNDDFAGAREVTRHLLDLGHRRIGLVAEPLSYFSAQERRRGFRAALRDAGLEPALEVEAAAGSIAAARAAAARILNSDSRLTAVFAQNDLLAIGTLQACRGLGIRVPDDLSLAGYDGTLLAEVVHPRLTTVEQPVRDIGRLAVELLHQLRTSRIKSARKLVLQPALRVGESTARPRAD